MLAPEVRLIGVTGLPEIQQGDSLGRLIAKAMLQSAVGIGPRDILVVAQKIVSKAEGRVVKLDQVKPSALAQQWARSCEKDPRVIEVILAQSRRILRMERGLLIAETHQGFVCANAGVDRSNTPRGTVTMLPVDCDRSARVIRKEMAQETGQRVAVIVADTFGRPWRQGLVNVALGVAGLEPLLDHRGRKDSFGRRLGSTVIAVADELASAAELVMKKTLSVPVAVVRGFRYREADGSVRSLIRPARQDLFR